VTVFEPRTNSSRRAIFQKDYAVAFASADLILLREPTPIEGLTKDELFSAAQLATDLNSTRKMVAEAFETTDDILNRLKTILLEGDVVAILSNGGFDNIHIRLLDQIRNSAGGR
jgi:UDP-N-acetylmuramate: L-alanyl-gamma-D-glutamyl-meso-diaminopimelate ligase